MPVSNSTSPSNASSFSTAKIPLLFGAFLALLGASVFSLFQIGELRKDVNLARDDAAQARKEVSEARQQFQSEIARFRENSSASALDSKNTIEALKDEIETARKQSRGVLGSAQKDANKKIEALEARLGRAQQEQAQREAAVNEAVSQVRSETDAARASVGAVSKEVSEVRTSVSATQSELEKTIEALKSVRGDLGIQSGLIATNAKELDALKAQGQRTILDFRIQKDKAAQRVGELRVRLKSTDPKKNRYTVEVVADDKAVEKKDKTTNEPVQFILAGSSIPYEMVVNEVHKDMIIGYLAEPIRPNRK